MANMMSTFKNTPANMNETCPATKRTSKSLSNGRPSHTPDLHETKYFFKQIHLPSATGYF